MAGGLLKTVGVTLIVCAVLGLVAGGIAWGAAVAGTSAAAESDEATVQQTHHALATYGPLATWMSGGVLIGGIIVVTMGARRHDAALAAHFEQQIRARSDPATDSS